MATQKGLGKGLGALFGDINEQTETPAEGAVSLPLQKIEPNPLQPRKTFDPDELASLAESIRMHGIIQPLTVRKLPSGFYQIIAGERRWRAARLAGLSDVPVVIIEADDKKAMELALIENLQRADLNPIEEALGYQELMGTYEMTQEQAAARVGKSRPAVANALRLLSLSPAVLELVKDGALSAGHARALLPVKDEAQQLSLAQKVMALGLSVRQTEALCKSSASRPSPPSPSRRRWIIWRNVKRNSRPVSAARSGSSPASARAGSNWNTTDRRICSSSMTPCRPSAKGASLMDENKNPQTQPEAAQDPGKPLSEKRKAALLRYMTILFSAAFVLVLISLILQMHSSEAKISELNAASTSALSNAEALQAENRSLQDEKIALEQENKELQAKLDELNEKLDAASQAEEDAAAAENEMIKSLRTERDRTKEAYEALLEAKSCDTREGNVTFSRAMQTLERLKDYLGPTALEEYQTLGGE